jgi:3-phytase (myo-inositol-hexaphosphate 3-phosphohydrolase)
VVAVAETDPVGTAAEDAADDPAIWRNRADPAASRIVGTDKKAGLHVYDLSGRTLFSETSGLINNVDLAELPDGRVVVVASDRNDPANARLRVWQMDPANGALTLLATTPGGEGEGYGFCLRRDGEALHAFSALKHGTVEEYRLTFPGGGELRSEHLRTRRIPTQIEGCVADPRDGTLYVGEEAGGLWRFGAEETRGELVVPIDNRYLVADLEGLALIPEGADGGWLVASSQGDNAFAVFRLPGLEPVGRFRVARGAFGSVEETDGIDLVAGDFGPRFPGGLFVAQDGDNAPRAQNFKLVPWAAIKAALGID